jgi:AraC-like DNA-binding protein
MASSGPSPPPTVSALPGDARMRYWRPAPELATLVSGYHLYVLDPAPGERLRDVFQPAWPSLRFTFGEGNWCVRQPGERWKPIGARSLFGPTSRVTWSESGAGLTVGIGLRPRGWARLTDALASGWADRVGDPSDAFVFDLSAIEAGLTQANDDAAVPHLFDAFVREQVRGRGDDDAMVGALEAALLDPELTSVRALAAHLGISTRSIERLSLRAFGFTPKLLMRRARFLRSLHAVARAPVAARATAIDPGYTDYSHFVRDAQLFLGMSPQAFLKLDTPLLRQSLALRQSVLGAPAQALAGSGW